MSKVDHFPTADQIDALLPQTQCRKCGFPACRPYAEAIAAGNAEINQCPPGGAAGIKALAQLTGIPPKPLNEAFGKEQPLTVAVILEEMCVGCVKCIQACPVDAIIGAAKLMHTIIGAECTGCELCVEPCPMDCIIMQPSAHKTRGKSQGVALSKQRYLAKTRRIEQAALDKAERTKQKIAALAKYKLTAQ